MKFLVCPTDKMDRTHPHRQHLPHATIKAEGMHNTKVCWECILIPALKKKKIKIT